jgi:phage baseplate assembly protein W
MTKAGERIRERIFGVFGYELVGRNMTESRLAATAGFAEDSMARWEPRATIHQVTGTQRDLREGYTVTMTVPFEVKELDGAEDVAEAKLGG